MEMRSDLALRLMNHLQEKHVANISIRVAITAVAFIQAENAKSEAHHKDTCPVCLGYDAGRKEAKSEGGEAKMANEEIANNIIQGVGFSSRFDILNVSDWIVDALDAKDAIHKMDLDAMKERLDRERAEIQRDSDTYKLAWELKDVEHDQCHRDADALTKEISRLLEEKMELQEKYDKRKKD